MSNYPARYDTDIVLRDGSTLRLRPIRPDDAEALRELHKRLSPQSVYFRFFAAIPELSPNRAAQLASVDYHNTFALVGELGGRIVAVARYYRNREAPDRAEVSFLTEDAQQGRGIATRMLERLADIAREHGIQTFDAYVLGENRKMMDVFLKTGYQVERKLDGGAFNVTFPIAPTPEYEDRAAARARAAATASMRVFFEPESVAVIGAGRRRGRLGAEIFHNLLTSGFNGAVYAVNKNAPRVGSVPAYASVLDIPQAVDLAIVAVPVEETDRVVDECVTKGVRGIVMITGGFAERGPEGRAREAALVEKIRAAGVRVIGPNCMGVINTDPDVRLNATFSPTFPPAGRVAFSTQSGALGLVILNYARRLNIGISTFASVGNKADVSSNDLIQYWAEDPRTDVILLYLESFGNPRNFTPIARRVARDKPIVAVKAGRSAAGARAASSHSGALAATDAAVDALFRQAGIIRTDTLEELFDVANLLANQPVPAGRRVAILTNAMGPAIMAADACEANGLELPALGEQTLARLRAFLPESARLLNPVDMPPTAPADHYRQAMRVLLADERVDSLIAIYLPPLVTDSADVAAAIVEGAAAANGKPVLTNFMSAEGAPDTLARLPSYTFPETAAAALGKVAAYGEWRRRPAGVIPAFADLRAEEAHHVVGQALRRGGGWLDPEEVCELLAAAGIPAARSRMAGGPDEAAEAAAQIGYPVALKAVGPDILHKTSLGAVALDLGGEGVLRAAYAEMAARLGGGMTGALVQEMAPAGVEVVVGTVQDPTFGPLVLYGSGGLLVELLADVAFRINPLTDTDAADMLNEVKWTALLRGYRGAPPADEAALRDIILRVSALLEVCPQIQEMDANPVRVLRRGAVVVDARVRVDRGAGPAPTRRVAY